jgi:hypothetical protein
LVGDRDVLLGQLLEAAVVVHVLLDLRGLVLRDALAEFLAAAVALEEVIGAAAGGAGFGGGEELAAQGAAAEAVDGLHLGEEGLLLLAEGVEVGVHGVLYLYGYNTGARAPRPVACQWNRLLCGHTPAGLVRLIHEVARALD